MMSWRWLWVFCLVGLGCAAPARLADLESKAVALNDSGYQYYRESRWNLAQEKFTQALALNRLIDRRDGIAANLNNLGVISQEQGNLTQALDYEAYANGICVNTEDRMEGFKAFLEKREPNFLGK